MPFKLRHEGKDILTIDEQVTGVRIQTSRGETSVTGVAPHEGVVDIIIDRVAPGGPRRLDQIEASELQDIRDRAEEGEPIGYARDSQVVTAGARADQGVHDETLREGGVKKSEQGNTNPPQVDLAQGLSAKDTDVLTARIQAFNDGGDAQKAIDDNPPSDQKQTSQATDASSQPEGRSGGAAKDTSPVGGPTTPEKKSGINIKADKK